MEIPTGSAARVARALLEGGTATASALAERLELTPAAIRRHLDALEADGLVTAGDRPAFGPSAPRGRGRPARFYSLTPRGRDTFAQAYDDLAVGALRFLAQTGGEPAVAAFARHRAQELVVRFDERLTGLSVQERAEVLARELSDDGYAASAEHAPSGVQLCQHHCPVAHVAAEFPQLCDAETAAFSQLLGTHVLRLATIAHGDGVCTTHVPTAGADVDADHDQLTPPLSGRTTA